MVKKNGSLSVRSSSAHEGVLPSQSINGPSVTKSVASGTVYPIPANVRTVLEEIFGPDSTSGIEVIYRPEFVRRHLAFIGGKYGSVTRPGKIYTNLSQDQFFAADSHVLHEFYHVIEQWGRQGMTRIGYLLRARRREDEASDFAEDHLKQYREALKVGAP